MQGFRSTARPRPAPRLYSWAFYIRWALFLGLVALFAAVVSLIVFGVLQARDDGRYDRMRNDIQQLRAQITSLESSTAAIGFAAYKAVTQSIPPGLAFVTGWTSAAGMPAYDNTNGGFNNATGVFTALVAAKYQVQTSICWEPGIASVRASVLVTSGTPLMNTFDFDSYGGSGFSCTTSSTVFDFGVGDTVVVLVAHTAGVAQTIATISTFSIERIATP